MTQSYRDLKVWELSMELAEQCYEVTRGFPKEELFGMVSQIRRAASSIPANIAEGQGRFHTKEFVQFLGIARGSVKELETHLELCSRVGLISPEQREAFFVLTEQISKMLAGLRNSLDRKSTPTPNSHSQLP